MSLFKRKIFPPEITEEILSRLPAKSLGRFKSVSKTWYSLISDPKFIKTHIGHQKTKKLLLHSTVGPLYSLDISALVDLSATVKEVIFPSYPLIEWKRIWGSCNGLFLAQDLKDIFFLMNPTTKELWKVPRNPFALPSKDCVNLVVMTGFGYDPSTDDYKIVFIENQRLNGSWSDMFVSVYSLRGKSWRKLPNAPYLFQGFISDGNLVNHNLHLLTSTHSGCSIVFAFSLVNEEFNEIQGPDALENAKAVSNNPLVFRGKLAISDCDSGDLWVMEEYGVPKSWTKVCSIYGINACIRPVCLLEGSVRDVVLGYFNAQGMVLVYNIDQRRCRNVHIDGVTSELGVQGTYAETVESPAKYIRTAP